MLAGGGPEITERHDLHAITGCRPLDPLHRGVIRVIGNREREHARMLGSDADPVDLNASPRCHRATDVITAAKRPEATPGGLGYAQ
jgi:hypothetical protein